MEYEVKKSDMPDFKWMVITVDKTTKFERPVCYIKHYYEDDKSIAESIVKSLQLGKYVPNLKVG